MQVIKTTKKSHWVFTWIFMKNLNDLHIIFIVSITMKWSHHEVVLQKWRLSMLLKKYHNKIIKEHKEWIVIVIVIVIHRFLWHWFRLNSWETLCYLYRVNKTLWERKSLIIYMTASRSWNNEIDTVLSSNESIAFIQHVMLE